MHPILVDLGFQDLPLLGPTHLFLPTYGVLFASAVITAWIWFMRRSRALGLPEDRLFNLAFYGVLAGILGAKALLVALDWRSYLAHPADLLGTIRSAGVLLGGVAAGALTFAAYCRWHGLPLWLLADAIAAPLALAQAIGRLGCFSAGCCWGVPWDPRHWLAVVFTSEDARRQTGVPLGDPRLAIQLVEMTFDLVLCAALTLLWRRRVRPAGTVFWCYVLVYGTGRAILETWRGDVQRGLFFDGAISTSQILALSGALLAAVVLVVTLARRDRAAAP